MSAQAPSPTAQATHLGGALRVQVQNPPQTTPNPAPAADPNRPEWLPEKFQSPEDLAAAYAALEKKLGGTPPAPAAQPDPNAPAAPATMDVKDFNKYSDEVLSNGKLSEESYKELEGKGFTRQLVDSYIQGQQAVTDAQVAQVHNAVGGPDAYAAMIDWAANNLSEAEQNAFDGAVNRGNTAEIMLAVQGLKARYDANNRAPQLIGGKPPGANPTEAPYTSTAELVAAMSDVRYNNDPAYRDLVERRLAKSDILG